MQRAVTALTLGELVGRLGLSPVSIVSQQRAARIRPPLNFGLTHYAALPLTPLGATSIRHTDMVVAMNNLHRRRKTR